MEEAGAVIQVLLRLLKRRVFKNPPAPVRVAALLAAVLLYGTTGFLYFELSRNPDLTWADGLWWSVVTVATVGYGDLYPGTPGGRFIVALPIMFFGIGLLGYVLSLAATALIQAKTRELHGMGSRKLKDHLVILNYPGLAKVERLLDELGQDAFFQGGADVVLVDEDLPEIPSELLSRRVQFVRGNPARDETLARASIDDAAYAVVLSKRPGDPHSDDLSVAITLAIEARAKKVHTVVECVDFETQELLRKAGCDSIVCTSRFDAHFLSHELLNPGVQEVIEDLTSSLHGQQIYLTPFRGSSPARFEQVAERCKGHGHLVLGVQRGAERQLNVAKDFEVKPGDNVISIGPKRMPPLADR
ncbi:MAG TPA: potassium channel family protein [Polyangiaceae bacterium]|nr:potassium channel family protein [Polyangiaceae bacterium]